MHITGKTKECIVILKKRFTVMQLRRKVKRNQHIVCVILLGVESGQLKQDLPAYHCCSQCEKMHSCHTNKINHIEVKPPVNREAGEHLQETDGNLSFI